MVGLLLAEARFDPPYNYYEVVVTSLASSRRGWIVEWRLDASNVRHGRAG